MSFEKPIIYMVLLKRRILCLKLVCIGVLMGVPAGLSAQETAGFTNQPTYHTAINLYDHQSYAIAAKIFEQVYLPANRTPTHEVKVEDEDLEKVNSLFYKSLSEMRLGNKGAEQQTILLIKKYGYAPMAHTASLQIGLYHFQQGDFSGAIERFKPVSENTLQNDEFDDLNFKYGYALFRLNQSDEASLHFNKVLNHPNIYQEDAIYYTAHIAYDKKQYDESLKELKKLNPNSKYSAIYPVYASQIYLLRGDIDSTISITKPLVAHSESRYLPLLAKALGSAYFFKEWFPDAAKAFDIFKASKFSDQETHQDIYQIGYSYYQNAEYPKAIKELSQLYDQHDVYAQNGLYTLGQCFLKTGQKLNARSAFQLSSQLNTDQGIIENSLIYYIKLSYEAGLDQDALSAAAIFVKNYSHSGAISEVKILQAEILSNGHNFADAYETLKSIHDRTSQAEATFKKVAYFYGIESYTDGNFTQAIKLFNESLRSTGAGSFELLAKYWKAESAYNLKDYTLSITTYQDFLNSSGAASSANYRDVFYGDGYAYFKKEDFARSLSSFEKYIQLGPKDESMKNDATMRMADCLFMQKSYAKATSLYNSVLQSKGSGSDYALFQAAMLEGLQKNITGKINTLNELLRTYPGSAYADDAQYEIAYAHFVGGNLKLAQQEFSSVISHYPESSYIPKALMNIGLIYYNGSDDKNALQYYQQVVSKYSGSPEAKNSLAAIRNIFIDQGNPDGFVAYAAKSGMSISQTGEDSLSYQAASAKFLNGDIAGSISSFDNYLQKFPIGYFAADAHFYRAQALQRLKKPGEALPDYEFLINKSTNSAFTENALVNASREYLAQQKWDLALPYLKRLELYGQDKENFGVATLGLATCYFELKQVDSCLIYTSKVIASSKSSVSELSHANLLAGKAYLIKADTTQSLKPLGLAARGRNIDAAESRYLLAFIQFQGKNYKASKKILFDMVKQLSNYDYWVAKSFVLLADNYTAEGDLFQARSTLVSVLQNYKPNDEVKNSAEQKLNQLQRIKK